MDVQNPQFQQLKMNRKQNSSVVDLSSDSENEEDTKKYHS